ncbi:MAG: hypothetical protein Q7R76_06285 [Candidatus Woesearchaeota archaeon]|nr:hypothetical protein [Candidatus Woesearchaeota archaeon]
MNMTAQNKPTYFDRFAEFIVEKGPSPNFWFVVFIISFTTLIIWLILKGLGIINTPWWLAHLPYLVGAGSLISFIVMLVEKGIDIGKMIGRFDMRLHAVENGLHEVKSDVKELRNDYRTHLVKYHA